MIKRFIRHLREGISNIGRHSAMSIASASAVTITLLLVSLFIMIMVNVSQLTLSVEKQLEIHVKINQEVTASVEIVNLQDEIAAIEGVSKVSYSSRDQELNRLIESYPELTSLYEAYRERNPLSDAFYVEVRDGDLLADVAAQITALGNIESADYGGEGVMALVNMLNGIRLGGLVLVGALTLLAVFLIANTIKVTILARREEIAIMRTVGATNGFIRAPFMVEGCIIGLLGSAIPIAFALISYYYLTQYSGGHLLTEILPLVPYMPFSIYLAAFLGLFGMAVGLLGSFISVTRYLRWKR